MPRVFQVDEQLLGNRRGVLGAEQGKPAAMLEPAHHGLILQPGHDHLAVELPGVFFIPGKCNRGAIGHHRCHCISRYLDAAIVAIFVRPPKALKGPTQTFGMTVVEPGKFDLEQSFIDQQKQESMHLLARVVRPKAPAKKGAAPQPEPTPRGKFVDDVLELVKSVYGVDVETAQLKSESHTHGNHTNTYKGKIVDLTAKKVQIYFYGDEKAPYQVALIFEYPEASHTSINPKIPLCLEAFAVGEAARRAFQGAGEFDEEGGEGGGAPPPI